MAVDKRTLRRRLSALTSLLVVLHVIRQLEITVLVINFADNASYNITRKGHIYVNLRAESYIGNSYIQNE